MLTKDDIEVAAAVLRQQVGPMDRCSSWSPGYHPRWPNDYTGKEQSILRSAVIVMFDAVEQARKGKWPQGSTSQMTDCAPIDIRYREWLTLNGLDDSSENMKKFYKMTMENMARDFLKLTQPVPPELTDDEKDEYAGWLIENSRIHTQESFQGWLAAKLVKLEEDENRTIEKLVEHRRRKWNWLGYMARVYSS
jgi:hypothetical protein